MNSADPLLGRLVDGRYRVDEQIARGGMATVYRATDTRLDRTVALKVMHPSFAEDPDFVARFTREARAAARLSNPHIVKVFDQGQDGSVIFLAMDYVPSRTLRDVLSERGTAVRPRGPHRHRPGAAGTGRGPRRQRRPPRRQARERPDR